MDSMMLLSIWNPYGTCMKPMCFPHEIHEIHLSTSRWFLYESNMVPIWVLCENHLGPISWQSHGFSMNFIRYLSETHMVSMIWNPHGSYMTPWWYPCEIHEKFMWHPYELRHISFMWIPCHTWNTCGIHVEFMIWNQYVQHYMVSMCHVETMWNISTCIPCDSHVKSCKIQATWISGGAHLVV